MREAFGRLCKRGRGKRSRLRFRINSSGSLRPYKNVRAAAKAYGSETGRFPFMAAPEKCRLRVCGRETGRLPYRTLIRRRQGVELRRWWREATQAEVRINTATPPARFILSGNRRASISYVRGIISLSLLKVLFRRFVTAIIRNIRKQ